METTLDISHQPYDAAHPVVCFDACSKALQSHVTPPRVDRGGTRVDPHDHRGGMTPLHVWIEPRTGRMGAMTTPQRTRVEFAEAMRELVAQFPDAEQVTVVLDNLNTHTMSALYAAFPPAEAAAIRRRLHLVHIPVHASWLNIAEVAISVLSRAVLAGQRMATRAELEARLVAWIADHNANPHPVDWTWDVDKARSQLPRVYPIPLTQ